MIGPWDDVGGDLKRREVPGGWLYRSYLSGSPMCYVPFPPLLSLGTGDDKSEDQDLPELGPPDKGPSYEVGSGREVPEDKPKVDCVLAHTKSPTNMCAKCNCWKMARKMSG